MIKQNLSAIRERIALSTDLSPFKQKCCLVAVSKTKPVQDIEQAYEYKQRHFGENYIQEIITKAPVLPNDIKWHFIGHLQSNKIKLLVKNVPNLYMIETLDSIKIANKLNQEYKNLNPTKKLKVLIQINTTQENTKNGIHIQDENAYINIVKYIIESCTNLEFSGCMTIGKMDHSDPTIYFKHLNNCRKKIAQSIDRKEEEFELSMGMSGDFEKAIMEGSTIVRIGSTIFGQRERK